jgi:hypothetical protein
LSNAIGPIAQRDWVERLCKRRGERLEKKSKEERRKKKEDAAAKERSAGCPEKVSWWQALSNLRCP